MTGLPSGFVATAIPARIANLGCHFARPADWVVVDLPAETPDFAKPDYFLPLAVAMAPFAAVVFTVGARPAYADGSVAQWLEWLAREQGYDPGPVEAETGFAHPAVGCWAMQQADGTLMRMRIVLCEDGGRLVMVGLMAPQALWSAVHDPLRAMLHSFRLDAPRGGSAPLAPAGQELPPSSYGPYAQPAAPAAPRAAVAADEDESEAEAEAAMEEPAAEPSEPVADAETAEPTADPDPDDLPVEELVSEHPATYAQVAQSQDLATLRPEHPLNERLLQSGAGFPGQLLIDHGPKLRCATVKAPAIFATLRVPYGFHVLDDSRRTLVHDGQGGVQLNLSRRARQGRDAHAFLLALLADLRQEQPAVQGQRLRIHGVEMLLVRGLEDGGAPLAQAYLLREAPAEQFLVLRCTSAPDDFGRAGNTAELLLRDAVFLDAEVTGPAWWREAVHLELQDRLEEAEQRILRAVDHLGVYAQVAHLYEQRGHRLAALGDADGAQAAWRQSGEWMDRMAAGATSGGEGAALSLQRDEHRARLGLPPYGSPG